jgi:hypothetical protein
VKCKSRSKDSKDAIQKLSRCEIERAELLLGCEHEVSGPQVTDME